MLEASRKPGIGLDIGTGTLVASFLSSDDQVVHKTVRDSFLELKPANKLVHNTMKKGLTRAGVNFFESEDSFFILGDDSLIQSVERQMVIRRPMSRGVISAKESHALPLFKALLRELLGPPIVANEPVVYSIPAAPIDNAFDVIYHEKVIETILAELGFKGKSINEGYAIILAEGSEDDFTGISISCGSGMMNIAVANTADLVVKFSISKSGDWIDENSALSLGYDPHSRDINQITPNLVTYVKEQGIDILNPDLTDRIKLSIAAHYKSLISYIVSNIIAELAVAQGLPKFFNEVPVTVAGGTSLAGGFMTVLEGELKAYQHKLPFKLGAVKHANKPMTAVSEGCLLALIAENG